MIDISRRIDKRMGNDIIGIGKGLLNVSVPTACTTVTTWSTGR